MHRHLGVVHQYLGIGYLRGNRRFDDRLSPRSPHLIADPQWLLILSPQESSIRNRCLISAPIGDGHILVDRPAAYADAGDHLTLVGERDAAAHRCVSPA